MRAVEVILQENYPQLGYVGDRVSVKRGFARNFLLPSGIAVEARSRNARELAHRLALIEKKRLLMRGEAEAQSSKFSQAKLTFKLKVGAGGKSFGSVTSRDIHAELVKAGYEIERKQVRLAEPIKGVGTTQVEVKLHTDVSATVAVEVIAEEIPKEVVEKKKARSKKGEDETLEASGEEQVAVEDDSDDEESSKEEA